MKIKQLLLATSVICIGSAGAATLQLSLGPGSAAIVNDAGGNPLGGATWGIVVDTGPAGFDDYTTALNGFTIGTGALGNDFFYLAAATTFANPVPGFEGAALQVIANFDSSPAIDGGESYKILWFETAGAGAEASGNFGLSAPTGTLPPGNGDNVSPTTFHGDLGPANLAVVPEPSIALLGALGFLGLIRRRR